MYKLFYVTKTGTHVTKYIPTMEILKDHVLKLFKRRIQSRAEKEHIVIGEVCKMGDFNRWGWYLDTTA